MPDTVADKIAQELVFDWPVHNRKVAAEINRQIDASFRYLSLNRGRPTVAEVLEHAQIEAEKHRQGPQDLVNRDVEYYFKSRAEVARRESGPAKWVIAAGGVVANAFYNTLKAGTRLAGHEEIMRTDKDVPTSPPGGFVWGTRAARTATEMTAARESAQGW